MTALFHLKINNKLFHFIICFLCVYLKIECNSENVKKKRTKTPLFWIVNHREVNDLT